MAVISLGLMRQSLSASRHASLRNASHLDRRASGWPCDSTASANAGSRWRSTATQKDERSMPVTSAMFKARSMGTIIRPVAMWLSVVGWRYPSLYPRDLIDTLFSLRSRKASLSIRAACVSSYFRAIRKRPTLDCPATMLLSLREARSMAADVRSAARYGRPCLQTSRRARLPQECASCRRACRRTLARTS